MKPGPGLRFLSTEKHCFFGNGCHVAMLTEDGAVDVIVSNGRFSVETFFPTNAVVDISSEQGALVVGHK